MKNLLLTAVSFVLLVSAGKAQDFENVEIKAEEINENIYVLFGAGGNIGVVSGEDGIILIDDQFEELGDKIKTALGSIAPESKVHFAINTHYHYDHTGGNKYFGKESMLIAHRNTRKYLDSKVTLGLPGRPPTIQEKYPSYALPDMIFDHSMALYSNGQEIQVIHLPNAHTDSDVIIYFPGSNVIHAGDIFVRYGIPFIDFDHGGTLKGIIEACDFLLDISDEQTVFIPGHGNLSQRQDVLNFRSMLQTIWDRILEGKSNGLSLEEIVDTNPTEEFEGAEMGTYLVMKAFDEVE